MSIQRICTGQVNECIAAAFARKAPLRIRNRFTRPVARVLIHSRQGVENRAFADIRIACKRNGNAEPLFHTERKIFGFLFARVLKSD